MPHVPPRPPDHGTGSKFLVPAHGPESTDFPQHSDRKGNRFPQGDATDLSRRRRRLGRARCGDAVANRVRNMALVQAVVIGLVALILAPGASFYFDVTP